MDMTEVMTEIMIEIMTEAEVEGAEASQLEEGVEETTNNPLPHYGNVTDVILRHIWNENVPTTIKSTKLTHVLNVGQKVMTVSTRNVPFR